MEKSLNMMIAFKLKYERIEVDKEINQVKSQIERSIGSKNMAIITFVSYVLNFYSNIVQCSFHFFTSLR